VILVSGARAALPAHQADDYVAEHIVGSEGADKFFKLGKVVGSAGFQTGTALSLWLVGRYVVPKNEDGSRSNKWSHLGVDLLRAQIVSQAMVMPSTQRSEIGQQPSAARFRQGTGRRRFPPLPCSSATLENVAAGGRLLRPVMSQHHGS
jgi:hypothetical protein